MNTPPDHRVPVLIFHGSPLMAAGLARGMGIQQDLRVFECRSSDELLQTIASAATKSVVVTDYEVGISVLAAAGGRTCRVLIVTDNESEVAIRRAIEFGVAGYLPLTSKVDAVIGAVRRLHEGATMIDPTFISRIAVSLALPSLTAREMQVLQLMMEGLPNKAIALRLERSVGTAKSHVKAILFKLGANTRVEAVAVAQRRGLLSQRPALTSWVDSDVRSGCRNRRDRSWPLASRSSVALSMLRCEEGT